MAQIGFATVPVSNARVIRRREQSNGIMDKKPIHAKICHGWDGSSNNIHEADSTFFGICRPEHKAKRIRMKSQKLLIFTFKFLCKDHHDKLESAGFYTEKVEIEQ